MTSTSDVINGLFEFIGSLLLFKNCYTLYNDKQVKGVNISTTIFFLLWGLWSIIFYPLNNLWFSFSGGILIVIANATWISLALWYEHSNNKYKYKLCLKKR